MSDKQFDLGSDEENLGSFVSPEMDSVFEKPFCLEREEAITLNKNYILYLSGVSLGSEYKVGLGLSSYESCVYTIGSSLNCTTTLPAGSSPLVNVRFAPDNTSLLYVGCSTGVVTLWDLRSPNKFAQQFKAIASANARSELIQECPLPTNEFIPSTGIDGSLIRNLFRLSKLFLTSAQLVLGEKFDLLNWVAVRRDTTEPKKKNLHEKNFCSFDVNSTGRFLCAGTEVTDGDAFLLFWDTRQCTLLGGYWDCHTDDVTRVNFHPDDADRLITGSTDGLINLFDISQADENEALIQSFNTESSVEKINWHLGARPEDTTISCVTHTADVQLWHTEDSAPYKNYSRSAIATSLQMSSEELANSLYVADVHSTVEPDRLLLLAGSNIANGRCLRSATSHDGKLIPHSYFDGNKQIVRCSWFDPQKELLVTGGEAGILSVWKPGSNQNVQSQTQLKATSKLKEKPHKTKVKPY